MVQFAIAAGCSHRTSHQFFQRREQQFLTGTAGQIASGRAHLCD